MTHIFSSRFRLVEAVRRNDFIVDKRSSIIDDLDALNDLSRPGFISWFGRKLGFPEAYHRLNQFLDSHF